jgi:hypothetical protein
MSGAEDKLNIPISGDLTEPPSGIGVELKKDTDCSVCMDVCSHNFCCKCSEGLTDKSQGISCPKCREKTDIQDIANDHEFFQLVEANNETECSYTAKISRCDICKNTHKEAIASCVECKELMCQDCTRAHQGAKVTRDHPIKSMDEIVQGLKFKIS